MYYHNKWGGFEVRVFASIPNVKGSNLMSDVVCDQQWYVDRIFSYRIFKIGLLHGLLTYLGIA
jgi:hypothetical protein